MGRRVESAPYLVALCAVLPLIAPEVWTGFRLAAFDPVLSAIAASEQPLSVRTPGGIWAITLALAWFALAYWRRRVTLWETALVLIGGTAALLRAGNTWLDAIALVAPLGRQLALARPGAAMLGVTAAISAMVAIATLITTRPPPLPSAAVQAAAAAPGGGNVFADWRWAGALQHDLSAGRRVLAANGLASESADFWLDYVRIIQDHERWDAELQQMDVNLLVLDTGQRNIAEQVRTAYDWRVLYDASGALVAARISP
jgi:hypothetical protein